ncbi:MAG: YihY/virulence factor BrkB family protein [Blastomonas fulva]|uniref:YihY/virulence factor BrkB family protein n=1 Tax=Blastomonas fulva TaxID=1550728 RepID=UPI0024E1D222|nr:YihY/virulence factor BrkB family protein [Blastomonas fulva]MDK2757344.1 YihY/virulence factor BrkB family protein [Blastomonas fulva]
MPLTDLLNPHHLQRAYAKSLKIVREVVGNVAVHGGVVAGNFAYLALLTIFPFFIVAAAMGGVFGRSEYGQQAVNAFLAAVPPSTASVIAAPMESAMSARTGPLLWLAVIVGLWTTGSLIETIRSLIRRAYGATSDKPFWRYRLGSMALIIIAVIATMLALSMQVVLVGAAEVIAASFRFPEDALSLVAFSQLFTFLVLLGMLYLVFGMLTPTVYRRAGHPIWPGPLFISIWWMVSLSVLPFFLSNFADYDLTYGSLAGVMVSLIFFFLIGLAMVIGAELNAAIARARGGVSQAAAIE